MAHKADCPMYCKLQSPIVVYCRASTMGFGPANDSKRTWLLRRFGANAACPASGRTHLRTSAGLEVHLCCFTGPDRHCMTPPPQQSLWRGWGVGGAHTIPVGSMYGALTRVVQPPRCWQREAGASQRYARRLRVMLTCRQPLFHSFPMPASQGRTHLRTSADCTACLCRSLTGWTLHDATTLSDRTH
jgi:hypothetical protein